MRLVDSHSHLFLDEFQSDLQQVMARAQAAGVTHIFMPNIDSTTIEPMLRVCSDPVGSSARMISGVQRILLSDDGAASYFCKCRL